jgi:NAD(P)-dependent dehydrogenase (short-subunit alcohol dehydrogenase family)
VLLGCRNAAKGQAALERLNREAPGAAAELVEVDMASLASIRSFATAFAGRGIPLDLLINNAGVMALPKREVSRRERGGQACLDWTERHHHIGGPLGVTLFSRLTEAGWLLRRPGTRAMAVTLKGREGLDRQLGVR